MRMTDGHSRFDVDAYVNALPRLSLGSPRPNAPTRYQVSRYPLLRNYNGFSGEERRRGGQLAGWLQAAGCLTLASQCDICGSAGPLAQHGEVYFDVSRNPTLCRPCHRLIHLRFYRWNDWARLVHASSVTGAEWFALIPRHPLDIAKHLRDRWGWSVADLERSPLCPLPEAIVAVLPGNMLSHPALPISLVPDISLKADPDPSAKLVRTATV